MSEIPGESPIDHWLFIVDKLGHIENEYLKDRTEFMTYDFGKFNILGEILIEPQYLPEGQSQLIVKYTYQKKTC